MTEIGISEFGGETKSSTLWDQFVGMVCLVDFCVWFLVVPIVCILQLLMSTRSVS